MNKNRILRLVIASLMAAMTCVATMVIKIPIPATGGYINLGDGMVILSGIILGPLFGGLAAGIGSALADLFSGYLIYAPATLIIKAIMAIVVGLIIKDITKNNLWKVTLSGLAAEIIMIIGYFTFEATFMKYGLAAAAAIPGNTIQGIAGIIVAIIIIPIIRKIDTKSLR